MDLLKSGTFTLSEACQKYRIPLEHFRLCSGKDSDNDTAENIIEKIANVIIQNNSVPTNSLEEGDLSEYENVSEVNNLKQKEKLISNNSSSMFKKLEQFSEIKKYGNSHV